MPVAASSSYWFARFLILRFLGFVYLMAFLSLTQHVLPLMGADGLLPVGQTLATVSQSQGGQVEGFLRLPSLFWFWQADGVLLAGAWIGVALSMLVVAGRANVVVLVCLWVLYMSYIHAGNLFFGYGWEIQTLETTFLACFLVPLWRWRMFPKGRPPSRIVIWLFRWLLFRIMLGAGLIKLRGDSSWQDLTALFYHFETQPIPNAISWYLHHLPHWALKLGVLFNHLVELVLPWFLLILAELPRLPRDIRTVLRLSIRLAGALMLIFQVFLIVSGNLSFLNWLTLIPCLACFDDRFLIRFTPRFLIRKWSRARHTPQTRLQKRLLLVVSLGVLVLVSILSIQPVANMAAMGGRRQIMNTSFNSLHLVNTYGAFGTVGTQRYEIVIEGTSDPNPGPDTIWKEYEFPGKPTAVDRRPPFTAPYHYRIDWQIWFAAMSRYEREGWLVHYVYKLLQNDPGALSLLKENPFPDTPPKYIRAILYEYRFTTPEEKRETGDWWVRKPLGPWMPTLSVDNPSLQRAFGPPKPN